MTQFSQLVLKIHSRCNLACDHCYVYEHADQSWEMRPVKISEETVQRVAHRLAEHAREQKLESVSVILHGGEPLLVGSIDLRFICSELTHTLAPVTALDLRIHTNGVLLRKEHLEIFDEFDVKVGVSLDGDRAANDRHRRDPNGRSSHDAVLRGIELLRSPEYRHLYAGLLCTVDVANDPVAVHDALTALEPPRIDYLLPHSTWDSPPPNPHDSPTPYADWLLAVFDRWEQQGRRIPVRIFESVLSTLRGGPSLTEALGLDPTDLAVVETDGTFEQADSLKTAYHGAAATGYDVFRHSFAEYAGHPGVRTRQAGIDGVSEICRSCPVVQSCGGGLYAHRYSSERKFDNPSVFCADLKALIDGITERITERPLSPAVRHAGELAFAQSALDRILLVGLNERAVRNSDWRRAWRALMRLSEDEHTAPHLVAALGHPYTRRWLTGTGDPARLMATVVAAAHLGRTGLTLTWKQPDPLLYLPTLGTLALEAPGRVEATVTADGWRVRCATGREYAVTDRPAEWRPLEALTVDDGTSLLADDADPYRDCFPVPAAPPLDPGERSLFHALLRAASKLRRPGDRNGLAATTVTPLRAGGGAHLSVAAPGALGVAVDCEPGELARQLPGLERRARLAALRRVADLHVAGNRAGQLIDEAHEQLGRALLRRGRTVSDAQENAARALVELTLLPDRELTETGAALVAQMWGEWTDRHD